MAAKQAPSVTENGDVTRMSPEVEPLPKDPPRLRNIEITLEDGVATITLNRPKSFNAMSPDLIRELPLAFSWLADRAEARAAIVTGAGRAFCAGGDVNWFKRSMDDDAIDPSAEVRRGADLLHQGILDLRRVAFPVVAAINGPAAGAGFSLALACDIRIASSEAFLAPAYGRIGVSPDGGLTWLLPRTVGSAKAIEILLDDPNIDAQSALEIGLVNEVVTPEQLLARANERARELSVKSPHYVRVCKQLVATAFDRGLADHLQLERHGIAEGLGTADARRGISAFLAGDTPEFHGD